MVTSRQSRASGQSAEPKGAHNETSRTCDLAPGHTRHCVGGGNYISAHAFTIASAIPREWDFSNYDDCMAYILADYQTGKRASQKYNADAGSCCRSSGGLVSETQLCAAPTGEEAQEAGRAPVETPFIGPDATLWMPPPAGPVAPPPSEVMR